MRRTVVYRALWLVSERDESARHIQFNPKLNLFAGENETGKSRVLKHIVWALGCEPTAREAGSWDVNVVAALSVTIGDRDYLFMRRGKHERAAFTADGKLLVGTESGRAWAEFFASIVDFPLKLQRHQEGMFALAGPEYALVPYYIDQEGGWNKKWSSFTRLSQFVRWEAMVFESFTGLRPPRYFEAQLTRDEMAYQLRESRAQIKVQEKSYQQVKAMLPTSAAKLDEGLFAQELKEISQKVAALGKKENDVRIALFDAVQQLQERSTELQMVMRAEQDLVDDLAYLSRVPDDSALTCPTCGQDHGVTFRARLELAADANDTHLLVLKVREQLEKLRGREVKLRTQLESVTSEIREVQALLTRRSGENGESGVSDIVSAKSLDTIALAYGKARLNLKTNIDEIEENFQSLKAELKALADAEHVKEVRKAYKDSLRAYSSHLDIDVTEIKGVGIGARPKMGSGSSGPRVFLATHMALLNVNDKYGSGPRFPFIVDTPRQQDLDNTNTAKLLKTIVEEASTHQLFIANGEVPEGWENKDNCQILIFDVKRSVLRKSEYVSSVEFLAPYVEAMLEAIRAEREAAANKEPVEAEDFDGEVPSEDDDDLDDEE